MNADRLLSDVQDPNWRRWLENVRYVPNTEECNDHFVPEIALRDGVRSQECENGVCMKMWFKERNGNSQIVRVSLLVRVIWKSARVIVISAIPQSRFSVTSDIA
uniref:Uncharacterized protein n=1 Tax=Acrobeloides nanus TaxID=290746 RepID=A0A914E770_9BILA